MQRNVSGGAQDRFAQPAHAEQQEQNADGDLQHIERHAIKERPERNDNERQRDETRERAEHGGPHAAHDSDREHDGERFNRLDQRCEKRRGHRRSGMQAEHRGFPVIDRAEPPRAFLK